MRLFVAIMYGVAAYLLVHYADDPVAMLALLVVGTYEMEKPR
jgi:hypothetical protein